MTKLQLTLTDQEAEVFRKRADELGYSLTKFVKFLLAMEAYKISEEMKSMLYFKKESLSKV
jgi:hypothetical protein